MARVHSRLCLHHRSPLAASQCTRYIAQHGSVSVTVNLDVLEWFFDAVLPNGTSFVPSLRRVSNSIQTCAFVSRGVQQNGVEVSAPVADVPGAAPDAVLAGIATAYHELDEWTPDEYVVVPGSGCRHISSDLVPACRYFVLHEQWRGVTQDNATCVAHQVAPPPFLAPARPHHTHPAPRPCPAPPPHRHLTCTLPCGIAHCVAGIVACIAALAHECRAALMSGHWQQHCLHGGSQRASVSLLGSPRRYHSCA